MATQKPSPSPKVCPTCGTRLSENATRCLVCGRAITSTTNPKSDSNTAVLGPRMPNLTLSLPLVLALAILLVGIGAGAVYFFARSTPEIVVDYTATPTSTTTASITPTATSTLTSTPLPTSTPKPPTEYTVKPGDTCSKIAILFNVSVQSIVLLNNLPADCTPLSNGQKLLIPQPTSTPTVQATSTPNAAQATEKACDLFEYTVKEGDTLGSISANFQVPGQSIKEYNGLPTDTVMLGQKLKIPLCKRLPTAGPTPTPTLPPPYAAPTLLLPADGAAFISGSDTIILQWSSVGTLRQNERYAVTIEDITDGTGKKIIDYATDTKYIIPASLRPTGSTPHIFRWWVLPVRQTGTNKDGQAIYEQAGAPSAQRVFGWSGSPGPTTSP